MNTKILLIASLFSSIIASAQKDFQGIAVYESKTSASDFKDRMKDRKDINPERMKAMEERMKTMLEKTFILNFDQTASIYKEEEKLESPTQTGRMGMMNSMMGSGGTFYKNVKNKTYTVDKEFMGKEFLIQDTLTTYKWQMTGETRQIGGYNCFKATTVIPASKTDFRNFRPKKEDDIKKEQLRKDSIQSKEKKTNFFDSIEMPSEIAITAWYTPEIPVNQGPESYWGLPGLILEINDGKTVILCSKIVLNTKDKVEIKAPTKGKNISQKEFDETMIKKMEEWREMYRDRNRR